uniref:B1160F02.1 protein n=1 Tax=Oryza sativa subsp. japonica TaxID=39947 RepID=Q6MWH5_ORYSJ|nr:B1160F02.1 [Oryza sativa Japonica Group]
MGFVSGVDDFAFPPGQAFQFGSLDFITDSFDKISLLDLDPNQSGGDAISAPEVGVILQPLGTVSTEELDGYLSSPGVDSRPMEIL